MKKPLLHKDIVYAQSQTKSHAEAARYLNTSFSTYKRYAQAYELYDTDHKNPAGKGVSKLKSKGLFGIQEILEGKHPNYDRTKLKERLIRAQYLPHQCAYCGHNKSRPDGRGPYKLDYKDNDRTNLQLDNLQLICYNCTYLTHGRVNISLDNVPFSDYDYTDVLGVEEMEKLREELRNTTFDESSE